MFEITSARIPQHWHAHQPYSAPSPLVTIGPSPFDDAYLEARGSDDLDTRMAAFRLWQQEVIRMYEEEGDSPPTW